MKRMYHYISWQEIENGIKILVEKIKNLPDFEEFTNVIGIERGGLIPAVMLSHALDIPYTTFDSEILFEECSTNAPSSSRYIIVDDIADSGDTLNSYQSNIDDVICSLYLRKHTCGEEVQNRLIYAYEIDNDDWLIFPWELKRD